MEKRRKGAKPTKMMKNRQQTGKKKLEIDKIQQKYDKIEKKIRNSKNGDKLTKTCGNCDKLAKTDSLNKNRGKMKKKKTKNG